VYGYMAARGTIHDIILRDEIELLQLKCSDILQGMSGAPVTVAELGGVVGVLAERYLSGDGQLPGTAWAVRIEQLLDLDGRLQLRSSPPTPSGKGSRVFNTVVHPGGTQVIANDQAMVTIHNHLSGGGRPPDGAAPGSDPSPAPPAPSSGE
jgi:hypothetical protein